ncbi:MAG: DUF805 domain-containing protein, partial [Chloroflexi bacterium]|nr:DUF805 domain-containing protein [Chloroflexota bacterium]
MNVQNSDEARAYELEYPRREDSRRRAFIGLAVGLLGTAVLLLFLFLLMFGLALGDVRDPGIGLAIAMLVALGIAVTLPFALAYKLGKAESAAEYRRRRDHALGIAPPLNFWYGMTGRINRTAYIVGSLVVIVVGSIVINGAVQIGAVTDSEVLPPVIMIPVIIVIYGIAISLMTRRLHDTGYSGWYVFLILVPYAGLALPVALFVVPGNDRPNKYGPQPPKFELRQ